MSHQAEITIDTVLGALNRVENPCTAKELAQDIVNHFTQQSGQARTWINASTVKKQVNQLLSEYAGVMVYNQRICKENQGTHAPLWFLGQSEQLIDKTIFFVDLDKTDPKYITPEFFERETRGRSKAYDVYLLVSRTNSGFNENNLEPGWMLYHVHDNVQVGLKMQELIHNGTGTRTVCPAMPTRCAEIVIVSGTAQDSRVSFFKMSTSLHDVYTDVRHVNKFE